MKRAVIVIPTYNEQINISALIDQIIRVSHHIQNWKIDILIVDSQSPDRTAETVKKIKEKNPQVHILETPKKGLGNAYVNGFSYALRHLEPFVVFEMDADLSHDPSVIPQFLNQIEKGADFVIGSRYIKGGSIPSNWALHRKFFSIFANLFVRLGFMKLSITDWTGGFRAMKIWVIQNALNHIRGFSGYVFQIALLDSAITHNAHIKEIPIRFVDRANGVSKINSIQYIIQTFWYVLSHSSFIKFVIVGLLGFCIDFGFAYFFIAGLDMQKVPSNMLSAEIAIVCNFLFNNFWSFRRKKVVGGIMSYLKAFGFFNVISLGSIVIQGAGLIVLLTFLGDTVITPFHIPSWILYKVFIIACVIIPYSYFLYNKVIWRDRSK